MSAPRLERWLFAWFVGSSLDFSQGKEDTKERCKTLKSRFKGHSRLTRILFKVVSCCDQIELEGKCENNSINLIDSVSLPENTSLNFK